MGMNDEHDDDPEDYEDGGDAKSPSSHTPPPPPPPPPLSLEVNQITKTMPICFASIDIGQSYLATAIVTRADILDMSGGDQRRKLIDNNDSSKSSSSSHISVNGKCLPRYRLVHLAIDEFAPGSAPHQPIFSTTDAFQAKLMEQYETQKAEAEFQKAMAAASTSSATTSTTTVSRQARRAAMGMQRKKAAKQKSKANTTADAQNMSEMAAVRGAADCIKSYYHRHGIQFVILEDQLPTVRRNRTIQAAIVAACHTLDIPVMAMGPSMKFMFASKQLQSEYRRIERERGSTLKTISTRLFESILRRHVPHDTDTSHHTNLRNEPDLCLLDLETFLENNEKRDWYDHVNVWYQKDLSDAFWQLVTSLKVNFDELRTKF